MTIGSDAGERRFQELAYRENEGIEVSLLWDPKENSVSVFVSDARSGGAFELAVGTESPLEIFNHPYAYAASRGIEPALGSRSRSPGLASRAQSRSRARGHS
jgi:hypothetical protein